MSASPATTSSPSHRRQPASPSDGATRFTSDVWRFFEELTANNDRGWYAAHRDRYRRSVVEPLEAVLRELEAEFGTARILRLARDVRFSKDPTPYKSKQAAILDQGRRGCLYLHIDASGVVIGGGVPAMDRTQLAGYRAAVAGSAGDELVRIRAALASAGFTTGTVADDEVVTTPDLARVPRGFDPHHRRADLLRLKRLLAARSASRPDWLLAPTAGASIAAAWRLLGGLQGWIAANVPAPAPVVVR